MYCSQVRTGHLVQPLALVDGTDRKTVHTCVGCVQRTGHRCQPRGASSAMHSRSLFELVMLGRSISKLFASFQPLSLVDHLRCRTLEKDKSVSKLVQEALPTLHTTVPVLYQHRHFCALLVEGRSEQALPKTRWSAFLPSASSPLSHLPRRLRLSSVGSQPECVPPSHLQPSSRSLSRRTGDCRATHCVHVSNQLLHCADSFPAFGIQHCQQHLVLAEAQLKHLRPTLHVTNSRTTMVAVKASVTEPLQALRVSS